MKALALAFVCLAACGGKTKQESAEGAGAPVPAKKLRVSWGIAASGSSSEVFLQTTDETGKQVSYPVGTYPGTCQVIRPADDMKALTGVNCTAGDVGVELHAVIQEPEIIVVKLDVQVGVTPDPMAREEVTRVKAPIDAAIEAAPPGST